MESQKILLVGILRAILCFSHDQSIYLWDHIFSVWRYHPLHIENGDRLVLLFRLKSVYFFNFLVNILSSSLAKLRLSVGVNGGGPPVCRPLDRIVS